MRICVVVANGRVSGVTVRNIPSPLLHTYSKKFKSCAIGCRRFYKDKVTKGPVFFVHTSTSPIGFLAFFSRRGLAFLGGRRHDEHGLAGRGGACVDGQLLGLGKVYVVCWFV